MSEIEIIAELDWDVPVDEELDLQADGRRGLPSASEYPRMWACPGYLNLKRILPPGSGKPSAYALSGQRVHAALAGNEEARKSLSIEEQNVFDLCQFQEENLVRSTFSEMDVLHSITEERLFFEDRFSGQFDRTYFTEDDETALTIDYKTGRIGVPGPESNLQMRAYAVLLKEKFPLLKKLLVAVIQPWVSKNPIVAEYDVLTLSTSRSELKAVLKISEDPDAKRIPGPHCKYCPGRIDCPEARNVVRKVKDTDPAKLVTAEQISEFLEWIEIANAVIDAVKDEAERRLNASEAIPGWTLAPGRTLETITKPELVFGRMSNLGVAQTDFLKTVKIGKGALKIALQGVTNLKGKALDQKLDEVLSDCVEAKTSKSYLKRAEA